MRSSLTITVIFFCSVPVLEKQVFMLHWQIFNKISLYKKLLNECQTGKSSHCLNWHLQVPILTAAASHMTGPDHVMRARTGWGLLTCWCHWCCHQISRPLSTPHKNPSYTLGCNSIWFWRLASLNPPQELQLLMPATNSTRFFLSPLGTQINQRQHCFHWHSSLLANELVCFLQSSATQPVCADNHLSYPVSPVFFLFISRHHLLWLSFLYSPLLMPIILNE